MIYMNITSLLGFLFLYNVDLAFSALIDRGINKKYADYSWCETGNKYTLIYMSKNSTQQWRKLTPIANMIWTFIAVEEARVSTSRNKEIRIR